MYVACQKFLSKHNGNINQFCSGSIHRKKEFPEFAAGDTITVYYEIREGEKVRTQFYRGVVIQIKGTGLSKTFTIRKMSGEIGVERIFPINLPALQKNRNQQTWKRSKSSNLLLQRIAW